MRDTLTVEDLERAIGDIRWPRWAAMVRDADAVEVRVTRYVDAGKLYVLDPNVEPFLFLNLPPQPVLVICHADDEAKAREAVAMLRPTDPEVSDG